MPGQSGSVSNRPVIRQVAKLLSIASIGLCFIGGQTQLQAQDDEPIVIRPQLIEFPGAQFVPLPEPKLHATAPKAKKEALLESIAGKVGWKRFSANSINAPVRIEVEELKDDSGKRTGYRILSSYVIYCSREKLENRDLMESSFGKPKAPDDPKRKLDQLALKALEEDEFATDDESRQYLWIELPLLKKVLIRAVLVAKNSQADGAFQMTWGVDSRFSQDGGEYQHRWSRLSTNKLGRIVEGETQPYQGMGGKMSVTPTGLEADQWLIESVLVIHEPDEWFGSSQYLRSKLPAALQESVKSFRRKLR